MSDRSYRALLGLSYAAGVVVLFIQPILGYLNGVPRGMLPFRGPDESLYLIRLQEGLLDPAADTTNGIWSGAHDTVGMQMALMERIAGWIFGWTGLDSLWVGLIVTAFLAPTAILLAAALMRRCGASRLQAFAGAVAFFIVMGLLRRFFNPSWSMPLTMLCLLLLWRWWERLRWRDLLPAGMILGLLPGVYFWSWTYAWAVYGLLGAFVLDAWRRPDARKRLTQYVANGAFTLVVASPLLYRTYAVSLDPLFEESSLRMGLIHARQLESLPRSLLILLVAAGGFALFRHREDRHRMAPLLAMAIGAFAVMHQQFVHGRIMSFSSHYYWYLCLSAALMLAAILGRKCWRRPEAIIAGCASLVLLGAAWFDYHGRLTLLRAPTGWAMEFHHLTPAILRLRESPRETVLSDNWTATHVAVLTDDDVVSTDYDRILLLSNREYIERYCLSEAFGTGPINTAYIRTFNHEKSRAGREQTDAYAEMLEDMANDICPRVDADIQAYLRTYEVTTVLWNERRQPEWDLNRPYLRLREQGDGWSLWDVER